MRSRARILCTAVMLSWVGCAHPTSNPAPTSATTKTADDRAKRPDAELLAILERLPPRLPVLDAIDAQSRSALKPTASMDTTATVAPTNRDSITSQPLWLLARNMVSDEVYETLCMGTALYTEMLALPGNSERPYDPMYKGMNEAVRRSCVEVAYRIRQKAQGGEIISGKTAAWLAAVGLSIGDPALELAANRYAYESTSNPPAATWSKVIRSASRAIEPAIALKYLASPPPDVGEIDPSTRTETQMSAELAKALRESLDRKPQGEAALEAAVIAARLSRMDLARELLTKSSIAPSSDLRAAIVYAILQRDSACPWSFDSSLELVCSARAWKDTPKLSESSKVVGQAYATGRGRTPWTMDLHLVFGQSYLTFLKAGRGVLLGLQTASDMTFIPWMIEQVRDFPPSPRATAISLTLRGLFAVASGDKTSPEAREREALQLLEQLPKTGPSITHELGYALARAVTARPTDASTPSKVFQLAQSIDDPSPSRARLLTSLAVEMRDPKRLDAALAILDAPAAWVSSQRRWEGRLLGFEARFASGMDASDAGWTAFLQGDLPSVSLADQVRVRLDAIGTLARLGHKDEAEAFRSKLSEDIQRWKREMEGTDLWAMAELSSLALRAHQSDPAVRDELVSLMAKDSSALHSSIVYYRAQLAQRVAQADVAACKKVPKCVAAAQQAGKVAQKELDRLATVVSPTNKQLMSMAILPVGQMETDLRFSLVRGLLFNTTITPRYVLMAPLPGKPEATGR